MEQGEELMHSNYEFMKFVGFWCMPYPSLRIKGKWQHRSMPWILIGEFVCKHIEEPGESQLLDSCWLILSFVVAAGLLSSSVHLAFCCL
jgi:hypothetical protein